MPVENYHVHTEASMSQQIEHELNSQTVHPAIAPLVSCVVNQRACMQAGRAPRYNNSDQATVIE
jgi:hypothetical protein